MKKTSTDKSSRKGLTAIRRRIAETVVASDSARASFIMSRSQQFPWMNNAANRVLADMQKMRATWLEMKNADLLKLFTDARDACASSDPEESLSALIPHLKCFGPPLFLREDGQPNLLFYRWVSWWEEAAMGDSDAEDKYRQVTGALLEFPSGRRSPLNPTQQYERKHARDTNSRTKRNNREAAQRLVKEIGRQTASYRKQDRTAEQAKEEAKRYVLRHWQTTSRAKNKRAIIAIVKEILSSNHQHENRFFSR